MKLDEKRIIMLPTVGTIDVRGAFGTDDSETSIIESDFTTGNVMVPQGAVAVCQVIGYYMP